MKKKFIVTGGSGFIGSNLVRFLIKEKDNSVVNLDKLTYAGNPQSLEDLERDPNYLFVRVDISNPADLKGLLDYHRPDGVMHLAAESHVDRSIDGPDEFIQTNIVGTYNLLQACLEYWRSLPEECGNPRGLGASDKGLIDLRSQETTRQSFRFLHVSTDEVYGSLEKDAPGFSETNSYDPHSPYSASKAASDHLVRAWGDTYGLPVLVTNCSNNYGPNQFPEKLIPVVLLKCLSGDPIPVYGKGDNVRDWLYVADHVDALYTVITKGQVGETYNIGGNNEQTNYELIVRICDILETEISAKFKKSEIEKGNRKSCNSDFVFNQMPRSKSFRDLITFVADRPGHDMRYAIDSSKIKSELGWVPKENLESGLRETVRWYLENKDWWEAVLNGSYQLERLGEI